MNPNLKIRKATSQDGPQAVILLYQAMGSLGEYIFGNGVTDKAVDVLKKLFMAKNNRFNFRHVYLAEAGDSIAGLLLAFRSNISKRLDLLTGKRLLGILRPMEMLQLLGRVSRLKPVKESGQDEFYISDLAVNPGLRGKKIGTQLLEFAEVQAGKIGLKRCSLIVTYENEGAKRFYLRNGYRILNFVKSPRARRLPGEMGFYRMVKEVSVNYG